MNTDGQMTLEFGATAAERFEHFHERNPEVYRVLVRLAREWRSKFGDRPIGMAALRERARWEIAIATTDPHFKINNNHTPFYARLIMAENPDLAGIFDLRYAPDADHWVERYTAA